MGYIEIKSVKGNFGCPVGKFTQREYKIRVDWLPAINMENEVAGLFRQYGNVVKVLRKWLHNFVIIQGTGRGHFYCMPSPQIRGNGKCDPGLPRSGSARSYLYYAVSGAWAPEKVSLMQREGALGLPVCSLSLLRKRGVGGHIRGALHRKSRKRAFSEVTKGVTTIEVDYEDWESQAGILTQMAWEVDDFVEKHRGEADKEERERVNEETSKKVESLRVKEENQKKKVAEDSRDWGVLLVEESEENESGELQMEEKEGERDWEKAGDWEGEGGGDNRGREGWKTQRKRISRRGRRGN